MRANGNHTPKPEACWLALGLVVWAIAIALGRRRRADFIDALERVAHHQEGKSRVVGFGPPNARRGRLTQASLVATAWALRLVADLRAALE